MAAEIGTKLKSVLAIRAQASVPRLEKLRINSCMVVEGLVELAERVETEECDCEAGYVDVYMEGWHDPLHPDIVWGSETGSDVESDIESSDVDL